MAPQLKKNVAGFRDANGVFRPIRSPKWVSHPSRKATRRLKAKYSRAKAGDLGKKRQERALEDVFDREIRLERERKAADEKLKAKITREIENDIYGEESDRGKGRSLVQLVRAAGGIRPGKKDAGELANFTFKDSGRRGLVNTRGGGKSLDGMFQYARESGYDVRDINDLLDRMDNEIRGYETTYKTHGYLDYRDNPTGRKAMKRKITKRNPSATKMAKAAISVFDTDFDLDVDEKDLRRLQAETRKLASRRKKGKLRKLNPIGWFKDVSPVTTEAIKKFYRQLAAKHHPDKGGSTRIMQEINADYDKAIKIAASNEGNASRADAERKAAGPLREAIEFAVTLPDSVDVIIRGLWLWIQGDTWAAKDQIKSFTASDGNRFKWAPKKKAWYFAAVPAGKKRGELSFEDIDRLHGRDLVKERKRRLSLNPKKKNPVGNALMAFAAGTSGILSALQIKEKLTQRAIKRTAGKTTAKRKATVKNPVSSAYLLTVYNKLGKVRSVHVVDLASNKPVKRFKTAAAARKYAGENAVRLVENPNSRTLAGKSAAGRRKVNPTAAQDKEARKILTRLLSEIRRYPSRDLINSAFSLSSYLSMPAATLKARITAAVKAGAKKQPNASGVKAFKNPAVRKAKANPERCLRCRKMTSEGTFDLNGGFCNSCVKSRRPAIGKKAAAGSRKRKANPKAQKPVARRRTYEMFQGRPATVAKAMPVSRFAPANLDQLGDLLELKLDDGQLLKLNPKRFKLCAAGGRLWIAGGKFAKANPAGKANELNPIAKISHVVYGTRKPHHGDHSYTHYIHKLGEDSGKLPTLAVDREGFPVVRGGNYTIEARGIVD